MYAMLKERDTRFLIDSSIPAAAATEGANLRGMAGTPIIHINPEGNEGAFITANTIVHEGYHVDKLPKDFLGVLLKNNPITLLRNFFSPMMPEEHEAYTVQSAHAAKFGIVPDRGYSFFDEAELEMRYAGAKGMTLAINLMGALFWLIPFVAAWSFFSKRLRKPEAKRERSERTYTTRDGFIQQGDASWQEFIEKRDEIRKNNLTNSLTRNILNAMVSMAKLMPLSQKTKDELDKRMQGMRIYGFDSIIKGADDFVLGHYDAENNELYLAENELDKMPLETRYEYLFHEIICPLFGHNQAILLQQQAFPGHYPDSKLLKTQDPQKPYKGRLGEYLRRMIDLRLLKKASTIQETVNTAAVLFAPVVKPVQFFGTVAKGILQNLLPETHAWLLQQFPGLYGKTSIGIYSKLGTEELLNEMNLNSSGMPSLIVADSLAYDTNLFTEIVNETLTDAQGRAMSLMADSSKLSLRTVKLRNTETGGTVVILVADTSIAVDAEARRGLLGKAGRQIVRELVEGKPEFTAKVTALLDMPLRSLQPVVVRSNDTAAMAAFASTSWIDRLFNGAQLGRTFRSFVYEFDSSSAFRQGLSIAPAALADFDVVTAGTQEDKLKMEALYPEYYKGTEAVSLIDSMGSPAARVRDYFGRVLAPVYSAKTVIFGNPYGKDTGTGFVFGVPKRWVTLPISGLSAKSEENMALSGTLGALADSFSLFSNAGIDTMVIRDIFTTPGILSEAVIDWQWVGEQLLGLKARDVAVLLAQPQVAAAFLAKLKETDSNEFARFNKEAIPEAAFTQWAARQQLAGVIEAVNAKGGNIVIDYPFLDETNPAVLSDLAFIMQTAKASGVRLGLSGKVSFAYLAQAATTIRTYNQHEQPAIIAAKGIEGSFLNTLGIAPEEDLKDVVQGARENKLVTVKLSDLRGMQQDEAVRLLSAINADNINIEMDRVPLFVENIKSFNFFELMQEFAKALEPKTEEGYHTEGFEAWQRFAKAASQLTGVVGRKLEQMQQFTVRGADGTKVTLTGSGLTIFPAVYQYMKLSSDAGAFEANGKELFTALYAIMSDAGIKGEFKSYIDQVYARFMSPEADNAARRRLLAQAAGAVQGLAENASYQQYLAQGGREFGTTYGRAAKKLLVKLNSMAGYDKEGKLAALTTLPEKDLLALAPGLSRIQRGADAEKLLEAYAKLGKRDAAVSLWFAESLNRSRDSLRDKQHMVTLLAGILDESRGRIDAELAKPREQLTREMEALSSAEKDEAGEFLALYYNALRVTQLLDRRNKDIAAMETKVRDLIRLRVSLKKSWNTSDLLLASLSATDDLLAAKDKAALVRAIETKEIDGTKILTPYGVMRDGMLSPVWLARYLQAKQSVLEQSGMTDAQTALRELNYWLSTLAGYAENTGTMPASFDSKTYKPAAGTDPEAVSELLLALDMLNAEPAGIKLDSERLPVLNVKALNAVLSSL